MRSKVTVHRTADRCPAPVDSSVAQVVEGLAAGAAASVKHLAEASAVAVVLAVAVLVAEEGAADSAAAAETFAGSIPASRTARSFGMGLTPSSMLSLLPGPASRNSSHRTDRT